MSAYDTRYHHKHGRYPWQKPTTQTNINAVVAGGDSQTHPVAAALDAPGEEAADTESCVSEHSAPLIRSWGGCGAILDFCHALPAVPDAEPIPTKNRFAFPDVHDNDSDNDDYESDKDEQMIVDNISLVQSNGATEKAKKLKMPRLKKKSQADRYKVAPLTPEKICEIQEKWQKG